MSLIRTDAPATEAAFRQALYAGSVFRLPANDATRRVVAAVNEGIRAARKMVEEEMGKLTGGLGIKLPGMG